MFYVELNDYQFVSATGPEAISFLQGQVTADMSRLQPELSIRGALCNLKGRVVADFRALAHADSCVLQTAPGMAQIIIASLAKYAVFSDLQLERDETIRVLGVGGDGAADSVAKLFDAAPAQVDTVMVRPDCYCVRVPGTPARFEIWCFSQAVLDRARNTFGDPGMVSDWHSAELRAGLVHIGPANSENFTPEELNFDLAGLVDFKKGCYRGQEVVARMHYRGKAKKRLQLLSTALKPDPDAVLRQSLASGTRDHPILDQAIDAQSGHTLFLAVLDRDSLHADTELTVAGAASAPAQLENLDYANEDSAS